MKSNYQNPRTPFTRTTSTSWQSQLRHSVRLYLAMGIQPVNAQELEALLQQTEEELVEYLMAGESPTKSAREQAQSILDMAQSELLSLEPEVQLLLRELSAGQVLRAYGAAA